ncbi:hypothetical protein [Hyphomonas sp.]|jgi:hypothetical protein|uniref:hypothetical protein n=1 Tax=Hyphomonas sp. TaxID=87 RepID=UPI0025BFDF67|nr:hypothetical protein [Hyphomonas sp.]
MWAILPALAFLCLAALHVVPALAAVRPALITVLYAVPSHDAAFALLHHRAALFAGVCALCLWAAFDPAARPAAAILAAISMVSFVWIYQSAGQPPHLRTIALADLAGLPALGFAIWSAFRPEARA